jgi:hypothetical protein
LEVEVVIEVIIEGSSEEIQIEQAFRPDLDDIVSRIGQFATFKGADISGLDVRGLISEMIRGVVGCERGCPADAKGLITRGYKGFNLNYIEGGILTAHSIEGNGKSLHLKMFPDF